MLHRGYLPAREDSKKYLTTVLEERKRQ